MTIAAQIHPFRLFFATAFLLLATSACGSAADVATTADDSPTATPTTVVPTTGPVELAVETPIVVEAPTTPSAPLPTAVPERAAEPPQPDALLTLGSEGAAVEDTQDLLNDFVGYADLTRDRIAEDGVYGPNTVDAQRSFENYAGLDVDGVASVEDRARLDAVVTELESDVAASVVSVGDESAFVGTWQRRLNIWNELVAELPTNIIEDDRFGPDTEQATLVVETWLGLQADGIVEPEDRAALRAAISDIRATSDATVLMRTTVDDLAVVVKTVFADGSYCMRFIVDFAADERCTPSLTGDINIAYFVTVNGVSFVGGTANPNVSFVQLANRATGTTPVATKKLGNSLARAWVAIVDDRPDTVELLEADGTSVLELRFSIAPTNREFFDSTISLISPSYAQTFFVDSCTRPNGSDFVLEASLPNAELLINVLDGIGSMVIDGGTEVAPIQITGRIDDADTGDDDGDGSIVVLTGTFIGTPFDGAAFTATAEC